MTPEELREEFLLVWREFFKRQKERHATHLEPATWKEGKQVVGKPLRQQGVENQAVITGIGILSPIGNDPETVTESLRDGPARHRADHPLRRQLLPHQPGRRGAASTRSWGWTTPSWREFDDPYLRFAAVAARRALRDAGVADRPAVAPLGHRPGARHLQRRPALRRGGVLLEARQERRGLRRADEPPGPVLRLRQGHGQRARASAARPGW